jgi:hypothetical protein
MAALAALHADGLARNFLVGDLVLRLAVVAEELHELLSALQTSRNFLYARQSERSYGS